MMRWSHHFILWLFLIVSLYLTVMKNTSSALPMYSSKEYDVQLLKRGGGGNGINGQANHLGGFTQITFIDRKGPSQSRPKDLDRRIETHLAKSSSISPPRSNANFNLPPERPKPPPKKFEPMPANGEPPSGYKKSKGKGHTDPETGMYSGPPQFVKKRPSRTQRATGAIKNFLGICRKQ